MAGDRDSYHLSERHNINALEFKSGLHTPRCTPTEAALESVCRSQPDGLRQAVFGALRWYGAPVTPKASLRPDTAAPLCEAAWAAAQARNS
jgi:hypothetical protein